jgi:outer membrane lipoprotein-sorting protein
MKITRPFMHLAISIGLSSLTLAAQADLGINEILQRARSAFMNARTYQAVFHTDMSLADKGSASFKIELKTLPGKKLYFRVEPAEPGTGAMWQRVASMGRMRVIDDGKRGWVYVEASKEYVSGPHDPSSWKAITMTFGIILGTDIMPGSARMRLKGVSRIGGRMAYLIEGSNSNDSSGNLLILIDKSNYQFLGSRFTLKKGGVEAKATTLVRSSAINGNIPETAFKFTPPAGAKQIALNRH